jgi:hypothetical protein
VWAGTLAWAGDIKHSLATLDRAKVMIDYDPLVHVEEYLERALDWNKANLS